jgi:hypothetical protein
MIAQEIWMIFWYVNSSISSYSETVRTYGILFPLIVLAFKPCQVLEDPSFLNVIEKTVVHERNLLEKLGHPHGMME